jgi:STE24 endopeptidase
MRNLLWLSLAGYLALRGILYYVQYQGSASAALRERAGRYFTQGEIDVGFTYARRGFPARIASGLLDLAVILVLLQASLATRLSGWTNDRTGGHWPLQVLLFVAVLAAGLALIHLPLDYYFGHVLEKRFGFSTQTAAGWLVREGKDFLLGLVLGEAAALLWFGLLRLFPRGWVLVIPAAFTLFQVAIAFLMPLILIPIYYKKSPLPEGPFRDKVAAVLARAEIRIHEMYVIDESRYSRHTNAFFAGLGPTKNIYLFDTLLKDHPEGEALTVVAHEAGHWREGHVAKGIAMGAVGLLAGCLLLAWLYPLLAAGGAVVWRPLVDPGSLPAVLLLAILAGFYTSPITSAISRRFETQADRASIELTGDRTAFIEAEKRLARTNHSQVLPHPLLVFWYFSHPPVLQRIALGEAGERQAP